MRKKLLVSLVAVIALFCAGVFYACGVDTAEYSDPTITLAYSATVIAVGDDYSLLDGVSVADEYDSSLAATVKSNGGFKNDTAGTYTVTYEATNSKGKSATATRTVTVAAAFTAPADGFVLVGGSYDLPVPALSGALSDATLKVEYKAADSQSFVVVSKTSDKYSVDLSKAATGTATVKYTVTKDKYSKTASTSLTLFSATVDDVTAMAGTEIVIGTPFLSENVKDSAVSISYKADGDTDWTDVADSKVTLSDAGLYSVKYDLALSATVTESVYSEIKVWYAGIDDEPLQPGMQILRKPVISEYAEGIDYKVFVTSTNDPVKKEITLSGGEYRLITEVDCAYNIYYEYTKDGEDWKTESYVIFSAPATTKDTFTFEEVEGSELKDGEGVPYVADNMTVVKGKDDENSFVFGGDYTLSMHFYTPGNWFGFKTMDYGFSESVNAVTFYAYAEEAFVTPMELYIETDKGAIYSSNTVIIKEGVHSYTLLFSKSFNTMNLYTFHLKGDASGDTYKFVYVDNMAFGNISFDIDTPSVTLVYDEEGTFAFPDMTIAGLTEAQEDAIVKTVSYTTGTDAIVLTPDENGLYAINVSEQGNYEITFTASVVKKVQLSSTVSITIPIWLIGLDDVSNTSQLKGTVEARIPDFGGNTGFSCKVYQKEWSAEERTEITMAEEKYTFTASANTIYTISYDYYQGETFLKSEEYVIFIYPDVDAAHKKNVLDFELVDEKHYGTATSYDALLVNTFVPTSDFTMGGEYSAGIKFANVNAWYGYKSLGITLEGSVNRVSVMMYASDDLVGTVGLWMSGAAGYSSGDGVTVKKGFGVYTFEYTASFSALDTYTFHFKTKTSASDLNKSVYIDNMYFYLAE